MTLASAPRTPAQSSNDTLTGQASTHATPLRCDEESAATQDFRAEPAALFQSNSQAVMADRGAALWRAIDRDLSPVIGRRATLALHRRALFLTRASLAWLPAPMEHDTLEDCLAQLCGVLATRSVEEADAAARALELTFHDLLVSLIGTGLTTQLLRSAGAPRPSDGLGQGAAQ